MKKLLALAAILIAKTVSAEQVGPSGFICPENLKTEQERSAELERFGDWAFKTANGKITTEQFIQLRMAVLNANGCAKSLANIQKNTTQNKTDDFVTALRKRVGDRVRFHSAYAELTVKGYHIDCKSPKGRYIPLINVLYMQADAVRGQHRLFIDADSRGEDVRIYHTTTDKSGQILRQDPAMQINKWGELSMNGVRPEAVLAQCGQEQNRIWEGTPMRQ